MSRAPARPKGDPGLGHPTAYSSYPSSRRPPSLTIQRLLATFRGEHQEERAVRLGLATVGGPVWLEEEAQVPRPPGAVQGPLLSTVHESSGLCVSHPLDKEGPSSSSSPWSSLGLWGQAPTRLCRDPCPR